MIFYLSNPKPGHNAARVFSRAANSRAARESRAGKAGEPSGRSCQKANRPFALLEMENTVLDVPSEGRTYKFSF